MINTLLAIMNILVMKHRLPFLIFFALLSLIAFSANVVNASGAVTPRQYVRFKDPLYIAPHEATTMGNFSDTAIMNPLFESDKFDNKEPDEDGNIDSVPGYNKNHIETIESLAVAHQLNVPWTDKSNTDKKTIIGTPAFFRTATGHHYK